MLKKHGKFYADWRDKAGLRHRKAFDTKTAAVTYQTEMQQSKNSHPQPGRSRRPLRSTSRRTATTRTPRRRLPRSSKPTATTGRTRLTPPKS
jgi:hypothetical protein